MSNIHKRLSYRRVENRSGRSWVHGDVDLIDITKQGLITALWDKGLDTKDIAFKVKLKEWQVYNFLISGDCA